VFEGRSPTRAYPDLLTGLDYEPDAWEMDEGWTWWQFEAIAGVALAKEMHRVAELVQNLEVGHLRPLQSSSMKTAGSVTKVLRA
jgi:hypothetical protein